MPEPVFAVPLDKLMIVRSFAGDRGSWRCGIGVGSKLDPDYVSGACRNDHSADSESAARAAAVAHLEQVHGIRAAGRENS